MARQRFAMTMLGGFAGFAMILAAIGVYGVMSFLVTQGTADIAIRMALGARSAIILSLIFRRGMALALVGMAAGVIGALGLTRIMSSMLFGVKTTDPLTSFSVLILLLLVALFACLFPGRRAMRVDPCRRCERNSRGRMCSAKVASDAHYFALSLCHVRSPRKCRAG